MVGTTVFLLSLQDESSRLEPRPRLAVCLHGGRYLALKGEGGASLHKYVIDPLRADVFVSGWDYPPGVAARAVAETLPDAKGVLLGAQLSHQSVEDWLRSNRFLKAWKVPCPGLR
jgi:hypothetical protein